MNMLALGSVLEDALRGGSRILKGRGLILCACKVNAYFWDV